MIYFKKRPLLFLTGILILWILLCHFVGIREQFPYPQSFDGKQVSCTGRVCQIEAGADFWYVYADHIQADFMEEVSERLKVRAILEEPADCAYGNWVQICGKLTLAEAPSNDGAFDRLFYQQTERLLFSMKNARLTVRDGRQNPLLQWMYEVRRICMRHLEQIFDEQDAGILAAMLLGDKSRLDEEIRDWYQVGGIAHVLAISGVKTLKLDIPLVPETRINWTFVPLHIAIIYILKLCLDEEIIPRCRFPCSRGYHKKYINWQKKQSFSVSQSYRKS